jgi:Leucine-rich repeat (LRR) protein
LQYLPPDIFKDLLTLKELALCWNSLKELDENLFVGLKDLKTLNLIGNHLKTLPEKLFEDLTSLDVLKLDNNPIESLSGNLFDKLFNLNQLKFSYALFKTVPDGLLKNNENLTDLKLSGKITKMSNKMFSHLRKLKKLDLLDNFCISIEIDYHNSNIAFTEEILIPCSCKALKETKSNFQTKALFIFFGVTVTVILFDLVLILIKMVRQKNFRSTETLLVFKNGE